MKCERAQIARNEHEGRDCLTCDRVDHIPSVSWIMKIAGNWRRPRKTPHTWGGHAYSLKIDPELQKGATPETQQIN